MSNPGTTNLIAWWSLDETSGTRADSHTNGIDLTDNNTVGSAAGKQGNAGDFDAGNTEYLSHADDALLQAGDIDITIGCWINLESLGSSINRVVTKRSAAGDNDYDFFISNTGQIIFWMDDNTATKVSVNSGASLLSVATWYFVLVWHDAGASTGNIQIDNGTPFSAGDVGTPVSSAATFMIGNLAQVNRPFNGLIDEVFIYKRVLTSDERTWLYNSGAGRSYADLTASGGSEIYLPRPRIWSRWRSLRKEFNL